MGNDIINERSPPVTVGDTHFESLGRIACEHASYIERGNFDGEDFLIATDFSIFPFSDGGLSICPMIKGAVELGNVTGLQFHKLDTSPYTFKWPQDARPVPSEVFPGIKAIAVPDGFMTLGKKDGGVYIV